MILTGTGWKNKSDTSEQTCECSSWKQHWLNYSGKAWPDTCSVRGCNNKASVGAHIYNTDRDVDGDFIVPVCSSCGSSLDEFDLKACIKLVPAGKQKTCK